MNAELRCRRPTLYLTLAADTMLIGYLPRKEKIQQKINCLFQFGSHAGHPCSPVPWAVVTAS